MCCISLDSPLRTYDSEGEIERGIIIGVSALVLCKSRNDSQNHRQLREVMHDFERIGTIRRPK